MGGDILSRQHVALGVLCQHFLQRKLDAVQSGELSARTFDGYQRACQILCAVFDASRPVTDLRPPDFANLRRHLTQRFGVHGLGTYVRMIRGVFRWAYEDEWLDQPLRYGQSLKTPPKAAYRRARRNCALEAVDIRRLLRMADPIMHAFILLGINCAYGQKDCAKLTAAAAHQAIRTGVLSFPRPKTGIERDAWLWPETRQALATTARHEGLAFLTQRGNPWVREHLRVTPEGIKVVAIDALGQQFAKLARQARISGATFYALRRTFRTVADEVGDPHGCARVMGHEIPGMAGVYIQRIATKRLRVIAEHVRRWLFGMDSGPKVVHDVHHVLLGAAR